MKNRWLEVVSFGNDSFIYDDIEFNYKFQYWLEQDKNITGIKDLKININFMKVFSNEANIVPEQIDEGYPAIFKKNHNNAENYKFIEERANIKRDITKQRILVNDVPTSGSFWTRGEAEISDIIDNNQYPYVYENNKKKENKL